MFASTRPGSLYGLALGVMTVLLSACGLLSTANAQQSNARLPLPDSVLPVTTRATLLQHFEATQLLHVTVCLKFPHPDQVQAYADAVSDPKSPLYRQFLTPAEIGARFGPAQGDYDAVVGYLQSSGLAITMRPVNRMTVSAVGTVAQIERAFGTKLNRYRESELDRFKRGGRLAPALTFFANGTPAQMPANLVPMIQSVAGLENYARPIPLHHNSKKANFRSSAPFTPTVVRTAYDLAPLYSGGYTGTGRTIGITNFDGFSLTSAGDYVTEFGLPTPLSGGKPTTMTVEDVDGGGSATATAAGEGDLDQQMNLGMAPLASIIVYAGPADSSVTIANYIDVLTQEVTDNTADVLTESYGWDISPATNYTSLHNQHLMMTVQGQTYLCASGDNGSGFAPFNYPFTDSEVLVVGGTVMTLNSSNQITSEVGWDDSGGGCYQSFSEAPRPSWQVGRGVSTTDNNASYRVFPDVAFHAAGSNSGNVSSYDFYWKGILQSGGSEIWFGTSFASPVACGSLAVVEQYLVSNGYLTANTAGKYRLGRLATTLYGFNGRNDVFYDVTSGSNGGYSCTAFWDYVTGWGSLDFNNLAAALAAPLAVNVTPQGPTIAQNTTQQLTATVTGSNVKTVTWAITSGPGSVSTSGLYTAPATVTVPTTAVVTATSTINTATAVSGSTTITIVPAITQVTISGTITLQSVVNAAQSITFNLYNIATASITTQTTTLSSTGAYTLTGITPGTYDIGIKGAKWLQTVVSNVAATTTVTGVNATLLGGDLDGDNVVTLKDYNILAAAFGTVPTSANWNSVADINCDNAVTLLDFNILASNFGKTGQTLP